MTWPAKINTEKQLEQILSTPSGALVHTLGSLEGDLLILGAGGKMGPSLAILAKNAFEKAGKYSRVIAVSRFTDPLQRKHLQDAGITTITCNLMDKTSLAKLPQVQNVIFMVGMKFGTAQKQAETWAINTYLPASICQKFSQSKIIAFSTANVYPLTPVKLGGSRESDATGPIGEYAQSALGRERIIAYFSETLEIPCMLIRLSYATELRYGVLLDIAEKVFRNQPIDLTMGHVNTIWQGDANEYVLRSFSLAQVPPAVLNVTGPELVSVRQVAHEFATRFGKSPSFTGTEADTALLSNAAHCHKLFGYPRVPLQQMIEWIAHWIKIGGTTLGKPTHYEVRTGEF